jgi:hypothetical protein
MRCDMLANFFMDDQRSRQRESLSCGFVTVKALKMTAMSKEAERSLYQRMQVQEKTTHEYLA